MSEYRPPLADLAFTLDAIVGAGALKSSGAFPD